MQKNQRAFQEADRLLKYFEFALEHLDTLLNDELNLPLLFEKIKRTYTTISFHNTLKLLKRTRIAF
jgi:hypothetical protein